MDSDRMLIFKMKQGNDAAWDQFIRRYYDDILKYCFFHSRDRDVAEDLTQDVFLRFFSALEGYQHRGKAKNYLYTIAGNLCRNQAGVRQALPLDAAMETGDDPSSDLDDRLMLEQAIRRLPAECREVVVLHYYQQLKLSEVAAVLHIGLPLVKYRLKKAKDELRKELGNGFGSSSSKPEK